MEYYEKIPVFDRRLVRGRRVLAALSGGADSVALLLLLAAERDAGNLELFAGHFHHGIRGKEADGDAAFCRALAERHGVPFVEGRADVPAVAREAKLGLETAARDARYAFLRRTARELGCDAIALAHHRDDQAETVLMHALRGSGIRGLSGMEPERDGLVRPLLNASKREILNFLAANGMTWREDCTNLENDTPRNILRNRILPQLEAIYPGCAQALARLAETAQEENRFLTELVRDFMDKNLERGPYGSRICLSNLPDDAVLRRAVHEVTGAEYDKVLELVRMVRVGGGRSDLSKNLYAECAGGWLYIARRDAGTAEEVSLNIPGETRLPGICRVAARESDAVPVRNDSLCQVLDADALQGAVLRTRRQGDRIAPLGMSGSKSLSDYFTDLKIPRPVRDVIPLIAVGSSVLWAAGCGISREAALNQNTKRAVRLEIRMEDNTNA